MGAARFPAMATPSDAELVQRARAGDQSAFGALYDSWFDRVYDLAYRVVRDGNAAADVAQDTFLAAWRELDGLTDPALFGGWIWRIARNTALVNRRKKDQRAQPVDTKAMAVIQAAGPSVASAPAGFRVEDRLGAADDPAWAAEDAELAGLVWESADALGERDAYSGRPPAPPRPRPGRDRRGHRRQPQPRQPARAPGAEPARRRGAGGGRCGAAASRCAPTSGLRSPTPASPASGPRPFVSRPPMPSTARSARSAADCDSSRPHFSRRRRSWSRSRSRAGSRARWPTRASPWTARRIAAGPTPTADRTPRWRSPRLLAAAAAAVVIVLVGAVMTVFALTDDDKGGSTKAAKNSTPETTTTTAAAAPAPTETSAPVPTSPIQPGPGGGSVEAPGPAGPPPPPLSPPATATLSVSPSSKQSPYPNDGGAPVVQWSTSGGASVLPAVRVSRRVPHREHHRGRARLRVERHGACAAQPAATRTR